MGILLQLFFGLTGLLLLWSPSSFAYPNFIGYGYTTCITCHYNNQGHGPLNDYGRALFAQEIAARPFIPATVSDEELADKSGLIPGHELPWWIRPGLKYRGLWFQNNPGGQHTISKFISMQRELNVALHFDQNQKFVAVATWNMLPEPMDIHGTGTKVDAYFREQYLRYQVSKAWYLLAGLFDKVYGLRIVDHTAFSRRSLALGQYDQTMGLTMQRTEAQWDLAVQAQLGDPRMPSENQQKGFSATGEYEIGEKHRLGGSLLMTQSESRKWQMLGVHDRWGLSHSPGSSLIWEIGMIQNTLKTADETKTGTYALAELLLRISRGYNLLSTVERYQEENKSTSPERYRWSLGGLLFPFQRTETRLMLVNEKTFLPSSSPADTWTAQGQIHVSF